MAVILVADDEETIRSLVALALTSAGHQVLTAANGLEALALFRSFPSRIDLVITDLKMPVMDGFEFVRTIQRDQPDAKIMCMTAYSDRPCPQGTTLLPKPFRIDQLREAVDRIMEPT
jgi:two-component system cell cycle response regulator CpdR